jgi:hypothetical protein
MPKTREDLEKAQMGQKVLREGRWCIARTVGVFIGVKKIAGGLLLVINDPWSNIAFLYENKPETDLIT